jgi:hypothetical protein
MNDQEGRAYYESRQAENLAQFDIHAEASEPFLVASYGAEFARSVLRDARERYEALLPELPYIGGDDNPMTRHLVRSVSSLVLYQAVKARGKTAEAAGKVIYDSVVASVGRLPRRPFQELSAQYVAKEKEQARESQERRYAGDWVWEFVEGDGVAFDYGYDFLECGTQKLYRAHGAEEFLPFYCYLDFVTHRTIGWGFARTMTLAEGHEKCGFRWKKGGETPKGWPPPFLKEERD